jgi:hypothetical protein
MWAITYATAQHDNAMQQIASCNTALPAPTVAPFPTLQEVRIPSDATEVIEEANKIEPFTSTKHRFDGIEDPRGPNRRPGDHQLPTGDEALSPLV